VSVLDEHRVAWARKPMLARYYREEFFARLRQWASGRHVVEVGAGPGFLKEDWPEVVALDIMDAPWIDIRGDCLALPFRDSALDAIVGLDVLHHLSDPVRFLQEVERVLQPGGRLALIEPWNTALARVFYTRFHREDFDLSWDPRSGVPATGSEPFDGNQAIPSLVFDVHWPTVAPQVPGLSLVHRETFSFVSYLLTGGFSGPNLLPMPLYRPINRIEARTARWWRQTSALRALIVLERS
jgi:SAM-dependent methyltransferase